MCASGSKVSKWKKIMKSQWKKEEAKREDRLIQVNSNTINVSSSHTENKLVESQKKKMY